MERRLTRRKLAQGVAAAMSLSAMSRAGLAEMTEAGPLAEFGYDQVEVRGALQTAQRENVMAILLGLNDDSLLQPFRQMAGLAGQGVSMGGWYEWNANYDHHHSATGLCPGHSFGQWTSALARLYVGSKAAGGAGKGDLAEAAMRRNALLGQAISPEYFEKTRFPAYSLDKLAGGLLDGHRLLDDPQAYATLDKVTDAALPALPGHAIDREVQWKLGADISWMWDECYTLPENQYLLSASGAGERYRKLAEAYLLDATYFEPLSRGANVLGDNHAYSYVNALCSAMQAYLTGGSRMHLQAAVNGFAMLEQQSYATGGWGPEELLRKPGYDDLAKSLTTTHNHFETPCGSYAHMKLTRYLLRATRDGRYGDAMERVMLNTVLGTLPLQADGRSFYHSDYNFVAKKVYSTAIWPCCSGTLPQVVADYGINSYFYEPGKVWVNLYQPSVLHWKEAGAAMTLEQSEGYLQEGSVSLKIAAARATAFELRLRIPAWAEDARLSVNGKAVTVPAEKGFAVLRRVWRNGDRVELRLTMNLRLEPLPSNGGQSQADTVALLYGPLVLFAIREPGETGPLTAGRSDLLSADRTGLRTWVLKTTNGTREMVPFTDISGRFYTTYFKAAAT